MCIRGRLSILSALFFLLACEQKREHRADSAHNQAPKNSSFFIDLEKMRGYPHPFSMLARISLSLENSSTNHLVENEILLTGTNGVFKLSKKNNSDLINLFSSQDKLLIKYSNDSWQTASNREFYRQLISDSININDWIINQFNMLPYLKHEATNAGEQWLIDRPLMVINTPFLKEITQNIPSLAGLVKVHMVGKIEAKDGLPRVSSFNVEGAHLDARFSLRVETSLVDGGLADMTMPAETSYEPLLYPINIASQFAELMKDKE